MIEHASGTRNVGSAVPPKIRLKIVPIVVPMRPAANVTKPVLSPLMVTGDRKSSALKVDEMLRYEISSEHEYNSKFVEM